LHLLIYRTSVAKGTEHFTPLRSNDAGHPPSYINSALLSGYRVERQSYWNCRLSQLLVCVYWSVRKCTVAKRLIGSGCRLGWWVGSVERWAY